MSANISLYSANYLHFLQSSIRFDSPQYFPLYLSDIYSDLLNRVQGQNNKSSSNGITMRVFFNYFNLQSFIGERIFISMDKNNDSLITQTEFINGFISLYQSDLNETCKFLFNMYDFNKDKIIFKLDVQLLLSHLPMKNESWEDQFKQIDDIGKELSSLSDKEFINFNEYYEIISTRICKHMIRLLNYLFEVKPFSVEEVNMYKLKKIKIGIKSALSKGAILPIIKSPEKKTTAFNFNKDNDKLILHLMNNETKVKRYRYESSDLNQTNNSILKEIQSQPIEKENDSEKENKKEMDASFEAKTPLMSKTKQNNSLAKFLPIVKKTSVSFASIAQEILQTPAKSQLSTGSSLRHSQSKDHCFYSKHGSYSSSKQLTRKQTFNEFQKTNYAGKFTKIQASSSNTSNKITKKMNRVQGREMKLSDFVISDNEEQSKVADWVFKYEDNSKIQSFKKYYVALIEKSILFFSTSSKSELLFIYNLSNTFIKGGECVTINKANYYPITINYNNTRYNEKVLYFVMDSTRKLWLKKIKSAANNSDIDDYYTLSNNLGEGRFGIVKKGIDNRTNKKVAVKVINKQKMKEKDYELIMKELTIMKMVNHPSLVGLIDYYENNVNIYLVMDLLEGGDLIELMQERNGILSEKEVAKIIKIIGLGIQYMNRFGLIHRDLKSENIILGRKGDINSVRIIDFGLTRTKTYEEIITDPMGTILYVAPEVLRRKPYDHQVDIWSIGVILYFLLGGILPFDDENTNEDLIGKKIVYSEHAYPKEYFGNRSKGCIALIDKCLVKNPLKRIAIDEFLQDNWLLTYAY